MDPQVSLAMPFEAYRQNLENQARLEAAEMKLDESVPGGVFLNAQGQKVNCNGEPIEQAQKQMTEQASESDYSKMSVKQLKEELERREIEAPGNVNKDQLVMMLEADDREFGSPE